MERYYSRRHELADVLARRAGTGEQGPVLYVVLAPRRRQYEVAYVGQTTRTVAERLRGHVAG
jgi:hypothetical protein